MTDHVLADASKRFAMRREAASTGDGINELAVIKETMAGEPELFLGAVREHSVQTATALRSILSDEMGARVLTSDPQTVEEDDILPSSDFGVTYSKGDKRPIKANVYLSLGTIGLLRKQFDPLLGHEEEIVPKHRLESAVVAGTWLALGKWAIDTLDPTDIRNPDTSVAAVRAVSIFTGEDVDQIDVAEQSDKIRNSLFVLSYRMAGAMAYRGMARYLKRHELPRAESVSIYQSMFETFYDSQIQKDPTSITPLSFALAKPLSATEVDMVLECLGPIADELRQENRLSLFVD